MHSAEGTSLQLLLRAIVLALALFANGIIQRVM